MKRITTKIEMDIEYCPFCAEQDELSINKVDDYYRIDCDSCDCSGPLENLPSEAIAAWNRRPVSREEWSQMIDKERAEES